jgi:hypothetical protein
MHENSDLNLKLKKNTHTSGYLTICHGSHSLLAQSFANSKYSKMVIFHSYVKLLEAMDKTDISRSRKLSART